MQAADPQSIGRSVPARGERGVDSGRNGLDRSHAVDLDQLPLRGIVGSSGAVWVVGVQPDLEALGVVVRTARFGESLGDPVDFRACVVSFELLDQPSYWCASRCDWIWATVSMVTLTTISSDVPPR
jgi:hypothetical protein